MSSSVEFRNFQLPFPENFDSLGAQEQGKLKRLQRLLKELNDEERPAGDVEAWEKEWAAFRAKEPSLCKRGTGNDPAHLVKPVLPSGAGVLHILHYPTYVTSNPNDATVFAPTNPCIARIAGSGFDEKNAGWLDLFSRRRPTKHRTGEKKADGSVKEVRFDPQKHVEAVHLKSHLEWLDTCLRASTAKVVVIYGQPVEKYFRGIWGNRLGEMKLWGDHSNISLWMLYPEGDDFTRVERLVLFAWHPEYIGQREDIAIGRKYDCLLGLAARLGGVLQSEDQVHFQEQSCSTPAALRRSLAAGVQDTDEKPLMRRKNGTKKGLTRDETPIAVACASCGTRRLDVTPYWYVPMNHRSLGDCIYLGSHGMCGICKKDKPYHPVDATIRYNNHTSGLKNGAIWKLLSARDFADGPDLIRAANNVVTGNVKVEEEAEPMPIPESEA